MVAKAEKQTYDNVRRNKSKAVERGWCRRKVTVRSCEGARQKVRRRCVHVSMSVAGRRARVEEWRCRRAVCVRLREIDLQDVKRRKEGMLR